MWQVRGMDRYFWFCYQTGKQPPRNVEGFCWFSHDCTLNLQRNGVLASGWYKAPHSYMINRTYYCPPFVKMVNFEHSQNLACWFCNVSSHHTSGMSGPGPLGPVGKISVVWSSPEGPQFTRFVGTLVWGPENLFLQFGTLIFQNSWIKAFSQKIP